MKAIRPALLGLLLVGISVSSVAAQANVSGMWQGVNYTSQVPGPHTVILVLAQTGSTVQGAYWVSTGVFGFGQGTVSGTTMTIQWSNRTTSCPGNYTNTYQLAGDAMTWTFTGVDCLGNEQGHGEAMRVKP